MHQSKYSKTDQTIHFISGANSYMFRHQGAITRELINNKRQYVQQVFQALFALISTIKVTNHKMLQLNIIHQHTATTTTKCYNITLHNTLQQQQQQNVTTPHYTSTHCNNNVT
jgi:hypothetical protein